MEQEITDMSKDVSRLLQNKKRIIGNLVNMIEMADKKRHEILDGRIRAIYGHSTPQKILKTAVVHPQSCIMGQQDI
ncbi:hypothetical protein [Paenibacillus lutimineralis]|uniref:Uncharacterized protein n=1 Tax=Paenibacillus lutimineralis TaxID=2707005 RepID=A0A3S9UUM7_9BACL|nr:hypothetical protein [Paenibacillus lutimineralis]AZS14048.1 hypothetical protein EI981_05985 [Paenibacillus lutimineralis]